MSVAKRPFPSGQPPKQKKRKFKKPADGKGDVLLAELHEFIRTHGTTEEVSDSEQSETSEPKLFEEVEVKILELSATGELPNISLFKEEN